MLFQKQDISDSFPFPLLQFMIYFLCIIGFANLFKFISFCQLRLLMSNVYFLN